MRSTPNTAQENRFDWENIWGWQSGADLPESAYVHVPFCRHRCGYCNFPLLANRDDLFDQYLLAVASELSKLREPRAVQTIFLGGGTPTILSEAHRIRLLEELANWLPINESGEWSMEANPNDIDEAGCRGLRALGINRMSIGGQSFQSDKLKQLERDHSSVRLTEAIECAPYSFPLGLIGPNLCESWGALTCMAIRFGSCDRFGRATHFHVWINL